MTFAFFVAQDIIHEPKFENNIPCSRFLLVEVESAGGYILLYHVVIQFLMNMLWGHVMGPNKRTGLVGSSSYVCFIIRIVYIISKNKDNSNVNY